MLMFVFEGHRGLVAYLCRSEILDGAGVYIAGVVSPLVALGSEFLEGRTVDTYESLLDNGLVLGVATLDIHHHGDWNTTGNPLYGRFHKVADRRHIACHTGIDKRCGVVAE